MFVGPNNSGKTTALQALALWDVGLRRWLEKRGGSVSGSRRPQPSERPGVTINRRDLFAVPAPEANLLWRNLHTRDVRRANGSQETKNVRIELIVDGVTDGAAWTCGLEFDYANGESFYCRPLRIANGDTVERMPVPEDLDVRIAFLPPMSGLADREFAKQQGEITYLIGQGRTAEVLRNLCLNLFAFHDKGIWPLVKERINSLFGVDLDDPEFIAERGEIVMTYRDRARTRLDLSASGRGLQQTLLLLAYVAMNPRSALLLDEPDAHLEILRQRQIYQLLTEAARSQGSQIIAASHSEVILNEAADRDVVVAFVGKPHRIDDRGNQLLKSLKDIGFEDYFLAEQTGWVLYLEGSTDLAILQSFAATLRHPAADMLSRPFVHYVQNNLPHVARSHYYGLIEARSDLIGVAIFDNQPKALQSSSRYTELMWTRREIENYLCTREVLLRWAEDRMQNDAAGPLFAAPWVETMEVTIGEIESALQTLGKGSPWSADFKASDDFLTPLFEAFFRKLGLPNLMNKSNFHALASYVAPSELDPDVPRALDAIVAAEEQAGKSRVAVGD